MVVQCYKEALQAIADQTFTQEKIADWMKRLRSVYNRDFWDGYYLGRKMGEWTERYGSQATRVKQYVGKITNYFTKLQVAEVLIETNSLSLQDEILIIGPTTGVYEAELSEIRLDLKPVETVQKGDLCSIPVSEAVRKNDKLYKWIEVVDHF